MSDTRPLASNWVAMLLFFVGLFIIIVGVSEYSRCDACIQSLVAIGIGVLLCVYVVKKYA